MRLLNRSAGRLSRHRRGPLAGLVVLLLGLLLTGGLYTAFSPAQAGPAESRRGADRAGPRALPRRLRLLPRPERRGHAVTERRQPARPVAGRRRRRRGRLPGRHRPDADGPARRPGPEQAARSTPTRRSPRSRRTSPRSAPARRSPTRATTASRASPTRSARQAIVRGGQIFLTNCTACHNFDGSGGAHAARRLRPEPPRRRAASTSTRRMLTGPQAMPNFSNGNLTPEDKRDVIAYLDSLEESPNYGGFGLGGLGPVPEGLFAWLVGIGLLRRRRGLDRRPHHPLEQEEGGRVSDPRPVRRATATTSRSTTNLPDPAVPTTCTPTRASPSTTGGRPTSTRRPRSAPSARSRPCSGCPRSARSCCRLLLRLRDRRRPGR